MKDEAGYYEIYKQGYVVSRQTFADLLKTLAEHGIIQRMVLDSHPPRVNYRLTEKGLQIKQALETILKEL
jgi:DNA-binding HxlR family transcriptional regulator